MYLQIYLVTWSISSLADHNTIWVCKELCFWISYLQTWFSILLGIPLESYSMNIMRNALMCWSNSIAHSTKASFHDPIGMVSWIIFSRSINLFYLVSLTSLVVWVRKKLDKAQQFIMHCKSFNACYATQDYQIHYNLDFVLINFETHLLLSI
jgi:hypothetical protein